MITNGTAMARFGSSRALRIRVFWRAMRVALLLAVCGCQQPAGPIFEPVSPPRTWPADPDKARFRYVGCLRAAADLKPPRKPLQGLARLFVGREPAQPLLGPRSLIVTADG
ncbi:MAG: hypothetical protein PVI86_13950, partial [Phycisphaerae bacterium]